MGSDIMLGKRVQAQKSSKQQAKLICSAKSLREEGRLVDGMVYEADIWSLLFPDQMVLT